MGHKPNSATKEVTKSEKKAAAALRTPAERLAAIRGSLAEGCLVSVTRDDQKFLLGLYDAEKGSYDALHAAFLVLGEANAEHIRDRDMFAHQTVDLKAKLDEFRDVYEQENSNTTIKVERVLPTDPAALGATSEADNLAGVGGESFDE